MRELLKVIIFHYLLQGLAGDQLNIPHTNHLDEDFSKDGCLSYCLSEVKPIVIGLNQLKERDAINKLNEKIHNLENELEMYKLQLTHKENQVKARDSLLNEKDESIKAKNELLVAKDEQFQDYRAQIEEKNLELLKYKLQDIPHSSLYADGIHRMKVGNLPAFQVSYLSSSPDWIVIQRRIDGSVDFDRDWLDYKNGFGDIEGNFFIGLEKLHLLTQSRPHELYIQLRDVKGTAKYARYDDFHVSSENDNYKLNSIGKFSGTAGDSLVDHVGDMFTTRDQDHDTARFNCAKNKRGGWWYHDCLHSNLNAEYHDEGYDPNRDGISWGSWSGDWNYTISLTFTQMMIRPSLK
ncbi:fibrinogen-like protein 1 [Drosophila tropicalis]|uniref:fibrinogen-like protein 1 n=1 Tax=Drosophila tropicalis TaxID=46794 RepID=UPI0035AB9D69